MSDGGLVYVLLLQRFLRMEIPFICENVQLAVLVRVVSAEVHSFLRRYLLHSKLHEYHEARCQVIMNSFILFVVAVHWL